MNKQLTTFYIVRHGETDWNKKRMIQGQLDIPLNATGEQQAKDAARKFMDITFDLTFSSDLLRARRTAEIIALEHKLAVQTTELLRERNFGTLQGQPSSALLTYGKLLQALSHTERKKYKLADDIESDEEVATRTLTFLRETAITHPGKNILVATHGGILRMLLIHLGHFTYEKMDTYHVSNTAYLKVTSDGVDFFIEEISGVIERNEHEH